MIPLETGSGSNWMISMENPGEHHSGPMENEYVMKQAMNVSYQRSVLYILCNIP